LGKKPAHATSRSPKILSKTANPDLESNYLFKGRRCSAVFFMFLPPGAFLGGALVSEAAGE